MGEEARSSWQPPAHPSPPPTPSSSDDSDDSDNPEPPPIYDYNNLPFIIATFFKFGRHHSQADFAGTEINIPWYPLYTWMNVSLRRITDATTDFIPYLRENMMLSFALVSTDERGIRRIRRVGRTMCFEEREIDDDLLLGDTGFEIGNYLDVSIRYPRRLMFEARRAITLNLCPH